jgi:hypothetical protein
VDSGLHRPCSRPDVFVRIFDEARRRASLIPLLPRWSHDQLFEILRRPHDDAPWRRAACPARSCSPPTHGRRSPARCEPSSPPFETRGEPCRRCSRPSELAASSRSCSSFPVGSRSTPCGPPLAAPIGSRAGGAAPQQRGLAFSLNLDPGWVTAATARLLGVESDSKLREPRCRQPSRAPPRRSCTRWRDVPPTTEPARSSSGIRNRPRSRGCARRHGAARGSRVPFRRVRSLGGSLIAPPRSGLIRRSSRGPPDSPASRRRRVLRHLERSRRAAPGDAWSCGGGLWIDPTGTGQGALAAPLASRGPGSAWPRMAPSC